MTTKEEICREAADIIGNDRQSTYGEPEDNLGTISHLKETFWRNFNELNPNGEDFYAAESDNPDTRALTAWREAIDMVLVKLGRIATGEIHLDNYRDAIGYLGIAAELAEKSQAIINDYRKSEAEEAYEDGLRVGTAVKEALEESEEEDDDEPDCEFYRAYKSGYLAGVAQEKADNGDAEAEKFIASIVQDVKDAIEKTKAETTQKTTQKTKRKAHEDLPKGKEYAPVVFAV